MSTDKPTLTDLEFSYFGGGSDAKYAALRAFREAGVDAVDVLEVASAGVVNPSRVTSGAMAPDAASYDFWINTTNGQVYRTDVHYEWHELGSGVVTVGLPEDDTDSEYVVNWDGSDIFSARGYRYIDGEWTEQAAPTGTLNFELPPATTTGAIFYEVSGTETGDPVTVYGSSMSPATWSLFGSVSSQAITDAVAALVDAAPEALDTLYELAAALDDDANFASTITTALASKADATHNHDSAYVGTSDSRLTDARTPTAHKTSHATGGSDALLPADIGAATSSHNHDGTYATSAHNHDGTYVGTSDSRLTDSRTPTAHKTSHATGGSDAISPADIGAATSSHNHDSSYVGTSDSRLTDARTPTAHKSSHATGGSDALTASDIGAASSSHTHTSSAITDLVSATGVAFFGDGADGTVTLNGTTDFGDFSTRSGSTYTLTRDVYFDSLTVNSTVTLNTGGRRIFVKGTATVNGTIARNGASPTSSSGSSSTSSGGTTVPTNTSAGSGGNGQTGAGIGATSTTTALGGAGGNGGAGSSGAGGTNQSFTAYSPTSIYSALMNHPLYFGPSAPAASAVSNGQGGGGGGGDGTNSGGGGGATGGCVFVAAKSFAGSGSIEAKGGNGKTPTTGNCGGGGGGGGGVVVVVTTTSTIAPTISVAGGTGGSGVGTGSAGSDGSAGRSFIINVLG